MVKTNWGPGPENKIEGRISEVRGQDQSWGPGNTNTQFYKKKDRQFTEPQITKRIWCENRNVQINILKNKQLT